MAADHKHRWVIYTSTKSPTRVGLLSKCAFCGREKFRGQVEGRRREQIWEGGAWRDYDGGWIRNYGAS